MTDATPPTMIHLDERWNECFSPDGLSTAWPRGGLLDHLVVNSTTGPGATGVAVIIASFAAEGLRDIPVATIVACGPDNLGTVLGYLRELAEHGYISLGGGQ